MKVAVLFDAMCALAPLPDTLILEGVEAVEKALVARGDTPIRVPVNPDGRWVERVRRGKFDYVFNLCEAIDGVAKMEPLVIAVLELFEIPFTGSSSATTALCLHKHLVNTILDRAGLPVPRWTLVQRGEEPESVGFPAICKPAAEDASIGIEQKSVVRSRKALNARVAAMHERWNEVVVQRFVAGREVNVGIVGDQVLPVAEIRFDGMPDNLWKIVSYRSKWETGSDEDLGAAPRCPADLPKKLTAELEEITRAAWKVVGGEGYGRADFRIDEAGRPWLLEVNSNPDLSVDAGLARMAKVAGMDYAALINRICESALTREMKLPEDQWARSLALSGA
jgi:D-alanine-D-alanine ligase